MVDSTEMNIYMLKTPCSLVGQNQCLEEDSGSTRFGEKDGMFLRIVGTQLLMITRYHNAKHHDLN
jgi:hypothetical protein